MGNKQYVLPNERAKLVPRLVPDKRRECSNSIGNSATTADITSSLGQVRTKRRRRGRRRRNLFHAHPSPAVPLSRYECNGVEINVLQS
jgi:hypothetical protein